MSGAYAALAVVSTVGAVALLGLAVLLVRLPLQLSAQRAAACEAERRRLAREMHDGLAQDLAGLGYLVDALAAGARDVDDRNRLEQLRRRITGLVAETRCSLVGLRVGVEEGRGLEPALETLAAALSDLSGVPIQVSVTADPDDPARLSPDAEGELFRIAQEALNNAIKHAGASLIRVDGVIRGAGVELTVTDDGAGFRGHRKGSHGLAVMQERARLVGATLCLTNVPDGGFRVAVTLPAERTGRRGSAPVGIPAPRSESPSVEVPQ